MDTVKAIPVEVYRSRRLGDCTNDGVSSQVDTLYLIHDKGFHDVPDDDPRLIRIVKRSFPWRETPYLHVEPVNPDKSGDRVIGPMFGGNFVYTSDSRFPADYPIPIHDRYETQEQYDLLSR